MGISLEETGVVVKYLGELFKNIRRQLQILSVNIIDESIKKALYIEMNAKNGKLHKGQDETSKRKDMNIVATTEKSRDPNRNYKHYYGDIDEKC